MDREEIENEIKECAEKAKELEAEYDSTEDQQTRFDIMDDLGNNADRWEDLQKLAENLDKSA
jgi:predicted DNA-binding protein YlxM (UPF0122 family)